MAHKWPLSRMLPFIEYNEGIRRAREEYAAYPLACDGPTTCPECAGSKRMKHAVCGTCAEKHRTRPCRICGERDAAKKRTICPECERAGRVTPHPDTSRRSQLE